MFRGILTSHDAHFAVDLLRRVRPMDIVADKDDLCSTESLTGSTRLHLGENVLGESGRLTLAQWGQERERLT